MNMSTSDSPISSAVLVIGLIETVRAGPFFLFVQGHLSHLIYILGVAVLSTINNTTV